SKIPSQATSTVPFGPLLWAPPMCCPARAPARALARTYAAGFDTRYPRRPDATCATAAENDEAEAALPAAFVTTSPSDNAAVARATTVRFILKPPRAEWRLATDRDASGHGSRRLLVAHLPVVVESHTTDG